MDDLHRNADKVTSDAAHLRHALDHEDIDLALSIAKRVRRTSTMLVKALAAQRDSPQEDTRT